MQLSKANQQDIAFDKMQAVLKNERVWRASAELGWIKKIFKYSELNKAMLFELIIYKLVQNDIQIRD